MKNIILLGLYLLLISSTTFAQHEQHQMSMPTVKEVPHKKIDSDIQTVKYKPKIVRYDLFVRDTSVILVKKPKRAIAVNG